MTANEFAKAVSSAQRGESIEYYRTRKHREHGLDSDCHPTTDPEKKAMQKSAVEMRDLASRLCSTGKVALVQKRLHCGETAYLAQVR